MEIQEIDVTIDRDGKVRIEVRGVKGESCLELTKGLEAALGGKIVKREMTAEARETPSQGIQDRERLWGKQG